MIGLDVTHGALLTPAWAERFRAAGRVGTFVAELVEFFKLYHQRTYGWDGAPIHDAVALAHSFRPGIVRTEHLNVEVETGVGAEPRPHRRRPLAPDRPRSERARRCRDRRRRVPRAPARADRDARLMPPGLVRVAVAAAGALAVAGGLVAASNGVLAAIAIVVGGLALLAWSVFGS